MGAVNAQPGAALAPAAAAARPAVSTSFPPLKQIEAGVLSVGYADVGPAYAAKFSGRYEHRMLTGGVGHNLPQEAPRAFADAVIAVDGFA